MEVKHQTLMMSLNCLHLTLKVWLDFSWGVSQTFQIVWPDFPLLCHAACMQFLFMPELEDGQENQREKLHELNAFGVETPGHVRPSSSMPSPFPSWLVQNAVLKLTA